MLARRQLLRGGTGALRLALPALSWLALGAAEAGATAPYARQPAALTTPWTYAVSTVAPLPEYPRPQLQRSQWLSLNGRWQYEAGKRGEKPPIGRALADTILVPFGVQSPLSGIERSDAWGWYRRFFTIPRSWRGQHVMLNFGAVSWWARVYVNGQAAGMHHGDYDAFSFDITRLLRPDRENELVVGFYDPVGGAGEPVGKQIPGSPYGYFHTAVSGIWQTVWLEPVAGEHVGALDLIPELSRRALVVSAEVTGGTAGSVRGGGGPELQATALDGDRTVATASGPAGYPVVLRIPHPHEWSPWDPFLYGLRLQLLAGGHVVDTVESYFGMRSISLGRVGGAVRILLNGKFVFQAGALDQGYWPDGLYTPPSDEAARFDIAAAKELGFDMLREHEKVEPDRWYYWADRLGILVWQDMPSMPVADRSAPPAPARSEFTRELDRIVTQHRSDPAIVVWVPFNEGWGQFDEAAITDEIKQLDPSSLVDTDSGSGNCCGAAEPPASDLRDSHLYSGPFAVPADRRATVIGEYGGVLPYPPAGHRWTGVLTSIGSPVAVWPPAPTVELLRAQYAELADEMRLRGLSAAAFTELAEYEQELGILTYDRRVFTMPPGVLRALNDSLIASSEHLSGLLPPTAPSPSDFSGQWLFSEGSGTAAADSSARHLTLTLQNGATWTAGPIIRGRPTGALSITAPGQAAVTPARVINTTRSFAVSAWLRAGATNESGTAVSEPGPDGASFSLGIDTEPRGTWWTFVVPGASNCTSAQCGVRANLRYGDRRYSARPGRWYQLTAVYDARTAAIALYVDGVPEDVEHVFGIPPATGPLTVGEGTDDYTPTDSFIGAIATLRTFGRALAPDEVWDLYREDASWDTR